MSSLRACSAIIIFGAGVRPDGTPSPTLAGRVAAALACDDGAALFVPTGAVGRFGPSEASVMAGLLIAAGVTPARIAPEETGTDTLSSVLACVRLLRARGAAGKVRVATSGYHLPRCLLLLRMAGLPARGCTPPAASGSLPRRWYWRLREMPALPYDACAMLARRRGWAITAASSGESP